MRVVPETTRTVMHQPTVNLVKETRDRRIVTPHEQRYVHGLIT